MPKRAESPKKRRFPLPEICYIACALALLYVLYVGVGGDMALDALIRRGSSGGSSAASVESPPGAARASAVPPSQRQTATNAPAMTRRPTAAPSPAPTSPPRTMTPARPSASSVTPAPVVRSGGVTVRQSAVTNVPTALPGSGASPSRVRVSGSGDVVIDIPAVTSSAEAVISAYRSAYLGDPARTAAVTPAATFTLKPVVTQRAERTPAPKVSPTPPRRTATPRPTYGGKTAKGTRYIINTSSRKIHHPSCQDVKKMAAENRQEWFGDIQTLLNAGYTRCKHCDPR